ncbi:MAG TPA: type VI secretion system protein TssA [Chthoniobacterales bacterium]
MFKVDDLLVPVSPEDPCGIDLSYDPALHELETLSQGKPETQFSEAEEPNWKKVRELSLALFGRTKDLRLAIYLIVAELQEEGFPGFGSGLQLLRHLVERYWDTLYPRLDPEFGNDPLERINLISSLSTPESTFGDPFQILRRVRRAPLCYSQRLGSISLSQIQAANTRPAAPPEGDQPVAAKGPDLTLIDAAFRDSDTALLVQIDQSLSSAINELEALGEFLDRTVGVTRSVSFDALKSALLEARKQVGRYLTSSGEEPASGTVIVDDKGRQAAIPGPIQTRTDVLRSLDAICAYYEATEPSSPVLPLLRRTQQLVGKNFTEILQELAPDTVAQVKLS